MGKRPKSSGSGWRHERNEPTLAESYKSMPVPAKGFRYIESIVVTLFLIIMACFGVELFLSRPDIREVAQGFIPNPEIISNPEMLYLALGILGATVMPHNLYLHSSIVQTRNFEDSLAGKKQAIRFATLDSTIALMLAMFVNAAILMLAASTFYRTGHTEIAEIEDAYQMLAPLLGTGMASILFAVALLASGQNSAGARLDCRNDHRRAESVSAGQYAGIERKAGVLSREGSTGLIGYDVIILTRTIGAGGSRS